MSANAAFAPSRASGQTNTDVLTSLVASQAPGTTFTYDQLREALEQGAPRKYLRKDVQQAVRQANHRLLRDHKRCLRVVRNVGYRLVYAREHMDIASERTRKGNRQMRWALEVLENAKLEEMTDQQRNIHIAQTAIANLFYDRTRALDHQSRAHARSIAALYGRMDEVEKRMGAGT